MNSEIRSLSELIKDVQDKIPQHELSFSELLEAFHERGFGLILLLFALPMALPIPVPPGLNIALATPLILLTAQQLYGRRTIWLPQRIRQKKFSSGALKDMLDKAQPWIHKIEWLIRPRLAFITQGVCSHFIGFCGLLMALAICVPIPLTNTVPSLGIALMAIGVLMRDGLAVLTGIIIGLSWISLLAILGDVGLRFFLSGEFL